MKVLQCVSPKSNKLKKRISEAEASNTKSKDTQRNENEDCASPMHIKLTKNKAKEKKENKMQKPQTSSRDKRTKRKQTKKSNLELNSTIVINECTEKKSPKKCHESYIKLKTKATEKTFRQTNKSQQKKGNNNQWIIDFQQKSTVGDVLEKKKKKNHGTKQQLGLPTNQEYLFIGDQFFLVNNLNPTKRLLNTFRENCKKDQPDSKFITQDKKSRLMQKPLEKKTNIFVQFRKEIELNNKIKKATEIQRWWRKILAMKSREKAYHQKTHPQNELLNNSQSKVSFKSPEQHQKQQKQGSFQVSQFTSSPINKKNQFYEDSFIASFNSTDKLDEENKPKKISFTKEDISKLIAPAYKLPQTEVNADQNEAVFTNIPKFKVQQANSFNDSANIFVNNSQKQNESPQKTTYSDHYQAKVKEQWSPKKVIDPRDQLLKEFQEATRIKEQIQFRTAFQKGLIKPMDTYNTKVGISTSILAIHTFLVKFFNFYIQKYQDQFISLINMPYGHSVPARLRQLQGYGLPEELEEDDQGIMFGVQEIIDEQKLEQFYFFQLRQGKNLTNFAKANLELQKIHNKSVIDLFNQLLNQYRPYKQINGVPYPWNHSYKALTFYFVTEDNIAEVFEKIQIKILKQSSLLSGIMLPVNQPSHLINQDEEDFDAFQFMQNYQHRFHPLLFEYNQEKQVKSVQEEVKGEAFQYSNEQLTKILIQVSNEVFYGLVLQNANQLKHFKDSHFY